MGWRLTPFAPASAPENIDEMLLQFEGREDELIETLRTMHERNVAQRARAAVQKTAKLEARAKASILSASELSVVLSELSVADSYSSGTNLLACLSASPLTSSLSLDPVAIASSDPVVSSF